MILPRVIPCLLLSGSGLVKTTRFKAPVYLGDPINAVRIFNEKEVDELILLDITEPGRRATPDLEAIERIASEAFMPVAYGGKITDVEQVRQILRAGVEKVCLNTAAVERPSLISEIADRFGSQSLVVSIDARARKRLLGQQRVYTHGGSRATDLDPVEHARQVAALGAGELLITSIDREGTLKGYDLALVERVANAVSIPVIASGGASGVEDFGKAIKAGASAAAAGSLFVFHGRHRAVLISFPPRPELRELFGGAR